MKRLLLFLISILHALLVNILFHYTDNSFFVAYIGGAIGLRLIIYSFNYLD